MKKVIVSLSMIIGAGFTGFAQEKTSQPSTLKIYVMEPSEKVQATELTKEEELASCKSLLEALDVKEAWIRSNPEELKLANENGWFDEAAATRVQLQARIKELESK